MIRKLPLALTGAFSIAALAVAGTAMAAPADGARQAKEPLTRTAVEARAAAAFARLDVNGDGKIDAQDREARHAQRFARLDTNNDGVLSLEEFTAGPRQMRGQAREAVGERPRGERRMGMGRKGRGSMGFMGFGMSGRAFAQGGAVTQAEFTNAALARFDKMDTNGDGVISSEERKAFRDQMRETRQQKRGERKAGAR